MMKKIVLLACLWSATLQGFNQANIAIDKEEWNAAPSLHKLDHRYEKESAIILVDKRKVEFVDEKNGLVTYKTIHKLIRVNDDKGIESYNKIYLPVTNNTDIVEIKARTILRNGKIIEIDKTNIKDLKEDDRLYKIFAMEGLEPGCELEYYYTYKAPSVFFGREVMQGSYPTVDACVEVQSPARLVFDTKSYNGMNAASDTILHEKRIITVRHQNINGIEEEKYSMYSGNLKRVEYKLSYNTSRSSSERLFTWNELAKKIYTIYSSLTEKELKKVELLVKNKGWEKLSGEKEMIIAVEEYLKKNFATREDIGGEDTENLEKIIKSKIASYRGIIRLYGAIYTKLGVAFQFVLCGSRNEFTVDKILENWTNCDNCILYFTTQKKYLAPTAQEMRYPWINPHWGNTNGVFCIATTDGNLPAATAEIKLVNLEDYTESHNDLISQVTLNPTGDTLLVDLRQTYSGYVASQYRASFNFTSAEDQKLFLKEQVKFGTKSENIVSTRTENEGFENYSENKPFVIEARVKAPELVERAGNKILVKIGDLIGQQVEMYQEKPRQFPMELSFPQILERRIEFLIPEGYSLMNPDDLNIKKTLKDDEKISTGFTSGYILEGNILKIHILEEYRNTLYQLTQYEEYKNIINAAADFNKVVLVLDKVKK